MKETKDSMTHNQREILKLIHYMLNSTFYHGVYSNRALKDILALSIRHFPAINSNNQATWKKIDLYLSNHRISERGAKIIDANYGEQDLWKLVHYEHIVPVSGTVKKLLDLGENPKLSDISKVIIETEVVILSKEEAKVLDGSISKEYTLDGIKVYGKGMKTKGTKKERLDCLNIKIDKRYCNNKLSNKIVKDTNNTKKGKTKDNMEEKAFVQKIKTDKVKKNREYWVNETSEETVELAERIFEELGEITEDCSLRYQASDYIGIDFENKVRNFIGFIPLKKVYVKMAFNLDKDEQIDRLIENNGLNHYSYNKKDKIYYLKINEIILNTKFDVIETLAEKAKREYNKNKKTTITPQ